MYKITKLKTAIQMYGHEPGGIHDPFREDPATMAHLKHTTRSYIDLLHLKKEMPPSKPLDRTLDRMLRKYFHRMQAIYIAIIKQQRCGVERHTSAHTKPFILRNHHTIENILQY